MSGGRVLIVSMPWARDDMPSIQVAGLQAFLNAGGVDAEGAHWFVDVAHALGVENYRDIWSPRLLDGEAVYGALLFPAMEATFLRDARLAAKARRIAAARPVRGSRPIPFAQSRRFLRRFDRLHQTILNRYDWPSYGLVGLTLNFGQTTASLYIAREIKKRNPGCRIIVGGAEGTGELGASLLRHFPQIDYACNGEGEQPLLNLVRALRRGAAIADIPGLISRDGNEVRINPPDQLARLDMLPLPDVDPYFAALDALGPGVREQMCIRLPLEASRGCYYACSFCSVDLQWDGVRTQSPEWVASAMRTYADRYGILEFEFADNVNPANADAIFARVAEDGPDYRFFFELRTGIGGKVLATMRRAGLSAAQMGIEALSSGLLRAFNKRATTIQNLQGMKNCAALGIRLAGNLIVNHPRATPADVEATLRIMRIARCYPPPDDVSYFALEHGAPDYTTAAGGTIVITGNHPSYRRVYPRRLLDTLVLTHKGYRLRSRRTVSWQRVITARRHWARHYGRITARLGPQQPHLAYYDGVAFLRIEDYRSGELEVYTLRGIEREVYLAAGQVTSFRTLASRLPHLDETTLRRELAELVATALMVEEDDRYLSLALPGRPRSTG